MSNGVRDFRQESAELRARADAIRKEANEILRRSDALVAASWNLKRHRMRLDEIITASRLKR